MSVRICSRIALMSGFRALRVGVVALSLLVFADAEAQLSTPPLATANHVNAVGISLSYGEQNEKDADFWGWSADYSRWLNDRWIAGLSLAWDEETERFINRPDKVVRSYTVIGTASYNLTKTFSLTTGLGYEIANDDNTTGTMKFRNGGVSTGLALGYTLPLGARHSFGATLSYEYNISDNETSVSADVSLGWRF